jgi:predicted DNA-binding transcriptional regulator AlpA
MRGDRVPELIAFDVRAAMHEAGLTVTDMVEITGKHRGTIWRWCRDGQCPPWAVKLIRLSRAPRRAAPGSRQAFPG